MIMKNILTTFFTVLFCLTSSVGWSLEFKDLVKRDGLYYKKFSEVPFNGKVEGKSQGFMKKGKKEGSWVYYHVHGHLKSKGDWYDGQKDGDWIGYNNDGSIWKKLTGTYKNGKKIND